MITENNKKWPSSLVATMGFLGGLVAISGIVGYSLVSPSINLAFITQQFAGTAGNPNPGGIIKGGNIKGTPGSPTSVGTNPGSGVPSGGGNPNTIGTANGLSALQNKIITLFSYYNTIPNGDCTIVVGTGSSMGSVSYDSSNFANEQYSFCALRDTTLDLIVQSSPLNQFNGSFNNIIPGTYSVECYAISRSNGGGFNMQMCKSDIMIGKMGGSKPVNGGVPSCDTLSKSKMIATASSKGYGWKASNAIDDIKTGNGRHSDGAQSLPQWITIDLGSVSTINTIMYTPRQDIYDNGMYKNFELYASDDGITFSLIKNGSFDSSKNDATITFPTIITKYIKFQATSSYGNPMDTYASVGELEFKKCTGIDLELNGSKITNPSAGSPIPGQPIGPQYSYWFSITNNPSASLTANGAKLKVTYKNLVSVIATGANCIGNTCIFDLPDVAPGNGIKVLLEGSSPGLTPGGNLEVFGELCDYSNDIDSTACNMSNSFVMEDDEITL